MLYGYMVIWFTNGHMHGTAFAPKCAVTAYEDCLKMYHGYLVSKVR